MSLEIAIKTLAKANLDESNDWYHWRSIKESKLPNGVQLPEGNQYKKNIALKNALYKKLENTSTHEERRKLFVYYIATWGGIHSNSDETIDTYVRSSPDQLVAMGSRGIASWSKALCITDPNRYAIYDARVAASINALQIMDSTENAELYPVLSSRNKTIAKGIKLFKSHAKANSWRMAPESSFYTVYLDCLESVASEFRSQPGISIATIEMLLFAKAEELVNQAFPKEHF